MTSMSNGIQDTSPVPNMTNQATSSCHLQVGPNQQDLIELLAQHFNQQVQYQLASATEGNNPTRTTTSNALPPSGNIDLLHQSIAQLQRQQQQYRMNQEATNFLISNRSVDSTASGHSLNSTTDSQSFLASQLVRSHQVNSFPTASMKNASTSQQQTLGHSPSNLLNDISLFSALNNCFSNSLSTNDQFMLSLQQQYLLQAATATNRQYGFKPEQQALAGVDLSLLPQSQHQRHLINQQTAHLIQQQHIQHQHHHQLQRQQVNQRTRRNQTINDQSLIGKNLIEQSRGNADEGRELLKFSINTILGQRSPAIVQTSTDSLRQQSPKSNRDPAQPSSEDKLSEHQREQRSSVKEEQPASSPECDPNVMTDFSSESTSSTPLQHQPGTAISFEQYQKVARSSTELDHQHQSAPSLIGRVAASYQHGPDQQQATSQHHPSISFLTGSTTFPWTTVARGKPRRGMMRRAVFSDSQRVGLEKRFQLQKYISKPDRKKLAEKLGLRDSQVKIWFQNRRMKWRNSKERELLSAGGSREQTLPTRNNPNPDLSDVGETIKKISSTSDVNAL